MGDWIVGVPEVTSRSALYRSSSAWEPSPGDHYGNNVHLSNTRSLRHFLSLSFCFESSGCLCWQSDLNDVTFFFFFPLSSKPFWHVS